MSKKKTSPAKYVSKHLYSRSGIYYAVFRSHGRLVWKSLRTRDLRIAKSRLKEFLTTAKNQDKLPSRYEVPTVSEMCLTLSKDLEKTGLHGSRSYTEATKKKCRNQLSLISRSKLGPIKVNEVHRSQVIEYLDSVAATSSGRNANIRIVELRRLFREAVLNEWIVIDPMQNVRSYAHKEKEVIVPTPDEVRLVLDDLRRKVEAQRRLSLSIVKERAIAADLIELIFHSGLRVSEAASLRWDQVDFELNQLVFIRKGGRECVLEMFPGMRTLLKKMGKKASFKGKIFPSGEGEYYYYPKKCLQGACKRAGVRPFMFHGLRHRFASLAVEAGIDFGTIAEWLGHKDGGILVGKRYGKHRSRKHLQVQAQSLVIRV